ncbi:MAG: hydrogenase expression/formation protein HypE [Pseudomonadota bacterium]
MSDRILLDHGEGGAASARLVRDVFLAHLGAPAVLEDAAVVVGGARLAISTDSFVVRPAFFPGGDIGKLAVCGTVNDLAVMGATPRYLTCAFILEEGLPIADLERVVASMAATACEAGVAIVAGDTKVVGHGEVDGLFVNTTGVGFVPEGVALSAAACRPGDVVLVSGPVGDHGTAVMLAREGFGIESDLVSDCQPLADLAAALLAAAPGLRCMRDPTRGGLATTLLELCEASGAGMVVREPAIPVRRQVRAASDLLGLDPLFVACEGRLIAVVPPAEADAALTNMRAHPRGRGAARIGVVEPGPARLVLETAMGGRRPLVALEGSQLPRIC